MEKLVSPYRELRGLADHGSRSKLAVIAAIGNRAGQEVRWRQQVKTDQANIGEFAAAIRIDMQTSPSPRPKHSDQNSSQRDG